MKKTIEVNNMPYEFDFMLMKFEEYVYRKTDLKACFTVQNHNAVILLYFSIYDVDFISDDNYCYTVVSDLYDIQLNDYDIDIKLSKEEKNKIFQIAQFILPKEFIKKQLV